MSSSYLLLAIHFSEQLLLTFLQGHLNISCVFSMLGFSPIQTKFHVSQQYFEFLKVFKLFVHLFVCPFLCSFLLLFLYSFFSFSSFLLFYFISYIVIQLSLGACLCSSSALLCVSPSKPNNGSPTSQHYCL